MSLKIMQNAKVNTDTRRTHNYMTHREGERDETRTRVTMQQGVREPYLHVILKDNNRPVIYRMKVYVCGALAPELLVIAHLVLRKWLAHFTIW